MPILWTKRKAAKRLCPFSSSTIVEEIKDNILTNTGNLNIRQEGGRSFSECIFSIRGVCEK